MQSERSLLAIVTPIAAVVGVALSAYYAFALQRRIANFEARQEKEALQRRIGELEADKEKEKEKEALRLRIAELEAERGRDRVHVLEAERERERATSVASPPSREIDTRPTIESGRSMKSLMGSGSVHSLMSLAELPERSINHSPAWPGSRNDDSMIKLPSDARHREKSRRSVNEEAVPDAELCFACVVFGAINMDMKATAKTFWPDHDANFVGSFEISAGGKGGNEAVALARLGVPVAFVGCVGCDAYGDYLLDQLGRVEGVDTSETAAVSQRHRHEKASTGTALQIVTSKDNRQMTVVSPEANKAIDSKDVKRASLFIREWQRRHPSVALLVQLELRPSLSLLLVELASELPTRCPIVLKPVGCPHPSRCRHAPQPPAP